MNELEQAVSVAEMENRRKSENLILTEFGIWETVTKIREWLSGRKVDASITLGTGLGNFGKNLPDCSEIDYHSLDLPVSGVSQHASVLRYVQIGGRGVLLFSGRKHLYEQDSKLDTTLMAVRSAFFVGAKTQILTCATGSVNLGYYPGQLVLIKDHINLLGVDPTRPFVAMTNVYDLELRKKVKSIAFDVIGDFIVEGVLASKKGPSFETPAEIRMLRALGADMAGMSTIHEAMALKELGARVLAISLVTNYGAGMKEGDISHEDNTSEGAKAAERFSRLLTAIVKEL